MTDISNEDSFKLWLRDAVPGDKVTITNRCSWLKKFHGDERICIFTKITRQYEDGTQERVIIVHCTSELTQLKLCSLVDGPDLLDRRTWTQ